MEFIKTNLKDAYLVKLEKKEDDRGFFARVWDKKIFDKMGLDTNLMQSNISLSKKKGTLRGMHYQKYPFEETKLIRCTHGKIYNVIIDLRPKSETFLKWEGIELDGKNHILRYIPKGFANGIQTLEDNTEIFYQVSQFYTPEAEKGIKWDDPFFNINWPEKISVISTKDSSWAPFKI
jgi:dTDP-4-dehydrorhamnose 3,5-epimerase